MYPEKRTYGGKDSPMTEAAIDWGFVRDLYISLGEQLDPSTWAVRVYHKPFVEFIWVGWLLMSLGGLLAVFDRRYRVAVRKPQHAPASLPLGAGAAGAQ
jgi:cytochrome c-type biogenesis protein CcmF